MKEKLEQELSTEVEVKILNNRYIVNFPNNGQFIRIQTQRVRMGDGVYEELINSSSDGLYARMLIDAIATFDVLIPKLKSDLNKNIFELSLIESKNIIKAYTKTYLPWYNKWTEIIQKEDEDDSVE